MLFGKRKNRVKGSYLDLIRYSNSGSISIEAQDLADSVEGRALTEEMVKLDILNKQKNGWIDQRAKEREKKRQENA